MTGAMELGPQFICLAELVRVPSEAVDSGLPLPELYMGEKLPWLGPHITRMRVQHQDLYSVASNGNFGTSLKVTKNGNF